MNQIKKDENFSVWMFFKKDKGKGICQVCGKGISCTGSSTSGMIRHLHGKHKIDKLNFKEMFETLKLPQNTLLKNFIKERNSDQMTTEENLIIDLVVQDRIPLQTIVLSKTINFLFGKINMSIPKCANTIKNLVISQAIIQKSKIKKEIEYLLSVNQKFSVSLDEFIGISNKRYM